MLAASPLAAGDRPPVPQRARVRGVLPRRPVCPAPTSLCVCGCDVRGLARASRCSPRLPVFPLHSSSPAPVHRGRAAVEPG
eukprot:4127514-Pleurochrysis_carterae.AAC.1